MGEQCPFITLYSPQAEVVVETIRRDGVCFSRREYVQKKYGESAPVFLSAYDWYVKAAAARVPKPAGAEYPYWAFADPRNLDLSGGGQLLTLRVPLDQVLLFYSGDWNKVLCLSYIGENEKEEKAFRQQLKDYGIRRECDVVLTNFYPELKRQVIKSWGRLFDGSEAIRRKLSDLENAAFSTVPEKTLPSLAGVQAGLWCIKKEWVTGWN